MKLPKTFFKETNLDEKTEQLLKEENKHKHSEHEKLIELQFKIRCLHADLIECNGKVEMYNLLVSPLAAYYFAKKYYIYLKLKSTYNKNKGSLCLTDDDVKLELSDVKDKY